MANALRLLPSAVLAGSAAGLLVLGLLGRLAMAVVAILADRPAHLSLRGTVETALLGAVIGAAGGVLILALAGLRPHRPQGTGVLAGILLFGLSAFVSWADGRVDRSRPALLLVTLGVAAVLFVAHGAVTERWIRHLSAGRGTDVLP